MFNDAMESTNKFFIDAFVKHIKDDFKGVQSLVDVGGGTGALVTGIVENFPHIECTVLVCLSGFCMIGAMKIVSRYYGDKDAIPSTEAGGKVIVKENMIGSTSTKTCHESQLLSDMIMLTTFMTAERDKNEWQKLFADARFGSYQITHSIGFNSVIEIYP
ncbi:O-methyltransferase family protein [Rhynchospora pubera]|uniref:O-methyltransferase family protein n=1 Tax=Rhynchospora pubera TaxID=906938 RepID=A0AAV8FYP2_9POAL|nr:O-methyltransferase family protein [Rhynchospora pubera]KAJ4798367.1 O-methyltransferase family protein [Rhynchospora pubera]